MISCSEYRQRARAILDRNWGMAILGMLLFGILTSALGFTGVGIIILAGPLELGLAMFFIKMARGGAAKIETLFDGFKYFVNSMLVSLLTAIFTLLWTLLLIIPGIVKSYSYSFGQFILADNPNMDSMVAIEESKRLTYGVKAKLFWLDLSFLGWIILSILTLGIGFLFLQPYMYAAKLAVYESVRVIEVLPQNTRSQYPNEPIFKDFPDSKNSFGR